MKKRTWLDTLENASLVGLGVGSVASLVFKEVLYTTTPLSLLVALGLVNRRRFEQMSEQERTNALADFDQRVSKQVEALQQQVTEMPCPETIHLLRKSLLQKNREVAESLYAEITAIEQDVHHRIAAVEQQSLASVRQELRQLDDRYQQLSEGLAHLSLHLEQVSTADKVEGLEILMDQLTTEVALIQANLEQASGSGRPDLTSIQEEIIRLDRQLSKLSPSFDLSSLRQEVGELVRLIGDLVPRRDLTTLVSEVKDLHRQQDLLMQSVTEIQTAALNLKESFSTLSQPQTDAKISAIEFEAILSGQLEAEIDGHPFRLNPTSANIYPELQKLAADYLDNLRSQLTTIQDFTSHLAQQQKYLWEQMSTLPKTLDVAALQRQMQELSKRIPSPETTLETFKGRIQEVLHQELDYINQQLHSLPAATPYQLVFDLNDQAQPEKGIIAGSRAVLEEALDQTQQRLILIWPWSAQCSLDEALLQKLEGFLQSGRQLDLGWCHLADRESGRVIGKLKRGWMLDAVQPTAVLQDTLNQLLQLKRRYPNNFQFKILGTSENYLVCDQSFAVLGIADALKTHNTAFAELQLKLRTVDPDVIQRLTQRFDHPSLEPDDLTAYWNRAVTRYDLGDKMGAIADFTHILSVNPDDAITYNYRGLVFYDMGQPEAALQDFEQSIQADPQQMAAYCNRAYIRFEQGDQGAAISDYSLALQGQSGAIAYFYRGMAWQKMENYAEAVSDYSEAIRLAPDAAVAFYYRGFAQQKLHRYAQGMADLEQAAQLFTAKGNHANAQKALKNLARLRQSLATHPEMQTTQPDKPQPDPDPSTSSMAVTRSDLSASAPSAEAETEPIAATDHPTEQTTEQATEQTGAAAIGPVDLPHSPFRNGQAPSQPISGNSELDTLINFFLSAHAAADQEWQNGAAIEKVESKAS